MLTGLLLPCHCTPCAHTQAHYILVKGGSLQIGASEAAPFPGSAKITLHGQPDARELPLYGAKVNRPPAGTQTCLLAENLIP